MTFILAGMNPKFAVQVSDRRISVNGRLFDDEAPKSFTLIIQGVDLIVAFTGLARYRGFDTYQFLMEALQDSGEPDFQPLGMIQRTAERLNQEFSREPLRRAPESARRLTISFCGFNCSFEPPRGLAAEISNRLGDGQIGKFEARFFQVKEPYTKFDWLGAFGDARAIDKIGESHLRKVLNSNISMRSFATLLSDRVRKVAVDPRTCGGVGEQLDIIGIPSDSSEPLLAYHLSMNNKMEASFPGIVQIDPSGSGAIQKIEMTTDSKTPLTIGMVHKNAPCPCGSGKKFKYCHRRWSV